MTGDPQPSARDPLPWLLALVFFATAAYFHNGALWAQTARLDAIYTFVEPGPHQGTFRLDPFLSDPARGINTQDWAQVEGDPHYYSNKAPGPILAGVPLYGALYWSCRGLGLDPAALWPATVLAYLLNLALTVLPVALSLPAFAALSRQQGASRSRALALTVGLYFGSLVLPYSTMLWGHATAAAFLVLGLLPLAQALAAEAGQEASQSLTLAGLAAGAATLCDYTAGLPALGFVVVAGVGRGPRAGTWVAVGGLGPALLMAGYHAYCFGDPLTPASSHSNTIFVDQQRVGGLFGGPNLAVAGALLGSLKLGLLWYSPPLLLLPWALVRIGRGPPLRGRPLLLLALVVSLGLLLVQASFNGWHGGAAYGPRYQVVALPCWFLLLVALPPGRGPTTALLVLAGLGLLGGLGACLFHPCYRPWTEPDRIALFDVLTRYLGLMFGDGLGQLRFYPATFVRDLVGDDVGGYQVLARASVWNLGERLGLGGLAALLPLLALWGGAGITAWQRGWLVLHQPHGEPLRS